MPDAQFACIDGVRPGTARDRVVGRLSGVLEMQPSDRLTPGFKSTLHSGGKPAPAGRSRGRAGGGFGGRRKSYSSARPSLMPSAPALTRHPASRLNSSDRAGAPGMGSPPFVIAGRRKRLERKIVSLSLACRDQ